MEPVHASDEAPGAEKRNFFRLAIELMNQDGVPYLIGGAYALAEHTGVIRRTKDLDVFVRPGHWPRVLELFAAAGFATELADPVWLAKIRSSDNGLVDVMFRSSNSICEVDDEWFAFSTAGSILGLPTRYAPPEEIIWTKSFVTERDRYDGADIAHYLMSWGHRLDWNRILRRFGEHWRLLLASLVTFGFIYPGRRTDVPEWVMRELMGRLQEELGAPSANADLCQGTLLSRAHYLIDVESWGFRDARFVPRGSMTAESVSRWKEAADSEKDALLRSAGLVTDGDGDKVV